MRTHDHRLLLTTVYPFNVHPEGVAADSQSIYIADQKTRNIYRFGRPNPPQDDGQINMGAPIFRAPPGDVHGLEVNLSTGRLLVLVDATHPITSQSIGTIWDTEMDGTLGQWTDILDGGFQWEGVARAFDGDLVVVLDTGGHGQIQRLERQ